MIYPVYELSKPSKGSKKYRYLRKRMNICLSNKKWAPDINYFKLSNSYVYLVMIINLYSRKILSWRVFNPIDAY